MTLRISIVSDVVCPWCYVGKRRLDRAVEALGLPPPDIRWLPFELNPDLPSDGMARSAYRAGKFGAERGTERDARMAATGREDGIAFAFDRMTRTPNTRQAHMLIAHAGRQGRADGLVEALFRAYFEEARDVGDPEVLLETAAAQGFDAAGARAAIESDDLRGEVDDLQKRARAMGISGVPFFLPDGLPPLSGAQPTERWTALLRGSSPAAGGMRA